jgi:hypothetical protein
VRPNTRYSGSFFAKSKADGSLSVRIALLADTSGYRDKPVLAVVLNLLG